MLLVSCGAPARPDQQLARVDFGSERVHWVDGVPSGASAMGLVAADDGCVALYTDDPAADGGSGMVRFDRELRAVALVRLRTVREAHTAIDLGDRYLVNSTGTDSLVGVDWPEDGPVAEDTVWRFGAGGHEVHVNSVLAFRGHVYVTMFGAVDGGRWFDARAGSVWDTTDDVEVCGGLVHPHSLFVLDDRLCVLESFSGRILDVTSAEPTELFRVPGYARGVVVHGDSLYVATSFVRIRSKHLGTPHPRSSIRSRCALYRIDVRSGEVQMRDLARDAREVYDVLDLDR